MCSHAPPLRRIVASNVTRALAGNGGLDRSTINLCSVRLIASSLEEPSNKRNKRSKSKMAKGTIIQVRPAMSIRELAEAMNKPPSHVNECLEQINYAQGSKKHDNWIINNLDVIAKVVKLSGFRFQLDSEKQVNFEEIEAELARKNETRDSRPRPRAQNLIKRQVPCCSMSLNRYFI